MATVREQKRKLAVVTADGRRVLDPLPACTDAGSAVPVAVLPFSAAQPDDQALAEGITEDLTMEMARFRNMSLAPRGACNACRPFADDTLRVARTLGVQWVIEGTVRRESGRVRVSVRLMDGETGAMIASERLEHLAADLLSWQEQAAKRIAVEMSAEIDLSALRRIERVPLENLTPTEMPLRARAMVLRGSEIEDGAAINAGIDLARRATEVAPHLCESWRVLAWALCIRGERGLFGADAQADYAAADEAATRLRAMDPGSYAAHGIMGHIAMRQGRHADALESLRHAFELNPSSMLTLRWLSWEESNHGLAEQAKEHAAQSLRLSPRDHMAYLGHWALALAHWVANELPEAAEHCRRAVALTPRFGGYYILMAACLAELGDSNGAAQAVARLRQNCPGLLESRLAGNTYFVDPKLAARYRNALARAAGLAPSPAPAGAVEPQKTALPPALAALTGREREVLRLVALGRSNAAVADALGISEHTAKRHIANILFKLDLPTRSAAASLAGRYGLA